MSPTFDLKPIPEGSTFPFQFAPQDMATLERVEVKPDHGRTYLWSVDQLSEVVARLIFAADDGDEGAHDLATFLLFVSVGNPLPEA